MFFVQIFWDSYDRPARVRRENLNNNQDIQDNNLNNNIYINYINNIINGDININIDSNHQDAQNHEIPDDKIEQWLARLENAIFNFFRERVFSQNAWRLSCPDTLAASENNKNNINNIILPVLAGLYLGMISFWNGAVLIAALLILFVLAIFSDGKLAYLITAIISLALALIQSHAFISESAFSFRFFFGFIAENRTVFGVLHYIWLLTGLLVIVIPVLFAMTDGRRRYLLFAFSAPFLFAFTISMTIDPTVNHKYIMISLGLALILVAEWIVNLFSQSHKILERAVLAFLCLCLTVTGIFETRIIYNLDKNAVQIPMNDPVTEWIMENTGRNDIFLTSNCSLNNIILSGAKCFEIWQYFAWSAGYDTLYRDSIVNAIYGAESPEELSNLTTKNQIAYIIVDDDVRMNQDISLNENLIASVCEPVFRTDNRNLTIYKAPEL